MIIMELKNKIDNPAFDGRKRSGWQARKDFNKGTRFALTGGEGGALSVRFTDGSGDAEDQRLVVALLSNAGPSAASSWREVASALPWAVSADAVLDALFAQGVVNEGTIRAAAQQAHEGSGAPA